MRTLNDIIGWWDDDLITKRELLSFLVDALHEHDAQAVADAVPVEFVPDLAQLLGPEPHNIQWIYIGSGTPPPPVPADRLLALVSILASRLNG